MKVKLELTY